MVMKGRQSQKGPETEEGATRTLNKNSAGLFRGLPIETTACESLPFPTECTYVMPLIISNLLIK